MFGENLTHAFDTEVLILSKAFQFKSIKHYASLERFLDSIINYPWNIERTLQNCIRGFNYDWDYQYWRLKHRERIAASRASYIKGEMIQTRLNYKTSPGNKWSDVVRIEETD